MSALYAIRYVGDCGLGNGVVYIGKGKIIGMDDANGRYHGTYTEENGRMKAKFYVTMVSGGMLVTGEEVPPGTPIPLTADLPMDFADEEKPQQILLYDKPVSATFEKIDDIP